MVAAQAERLRIFAQFGQSRKIEGIARTAQIRAIAQLAQRSLESEILICEILININVN